jgi:hypothetical protein
LICTFFSGWGFATGAGTGAGVGTEAGRPLVAGLI